MATRFFGRVLMPEAQTVVGVRMETLVLANAALSAECLADGSVADGTTTLQVKT